MLPPEIRYRGQKVVWEEIAERPRQAKGNPVPKVTLPYGGTPPTASHPWKQRYDRMKVWRPAAREPLHSGETVLASPSAPP